MEWIEAKLHTTSQGVEPVSAMLMECGITGIQIEDHEDMKKFLVSNPFHWDYVDEDLMNSPAGDVLVKFYVTANSHGRETLAMVENGVSRLRKTELGVDPGTLALSLENTDDEEWLNNWKKYYKPFPVGQRIIIQPVWETVAPQDEKIIFRINPGHVFGTGLHQTTQLCIEQLEQYSAGASLLDLGCGSGILSIISLMLGATKAAAVDLDPNAVDVAYENATLNNVDKSKYTVTAGDILSDQALRSVIRHKKYDVIVANIVADVIISLSPLAKECLAKGGVFIASGIIRERLEDVIGALSANGLAVIGTHIKNDWVCVTAAHEENGEAHA